MTQEQKINYMRIATSIVGYGFDEKALDLMVSIYELVIEKQGKTDLHMITAVKSDVDSRASAKKKSELLDKVSEVVK